MADLRQLIHHTLKAADSSPHGRHAEILVHDGPLRQTVIALRAGVELGEHDAPPAASIQVLRGRIAIIGQESIEMADGTIAALVHARHAVRALEDSVFLLTAVTNVRA